MSHKPRVSVLMPSYNHMAYIGEAIESVLDQTMKDFELIIVDDGSTDNSWEIIKHYAGLDSRIIATKQENQGPSAAINHAFEQARGDLIATHTSDDRSASTRLEKQVAFLDAHSGYDVVGSFIDEIDGNGQVRANGVCMSWFNVSIDINDASSWIWKNVIASPTLMLRRSFFERYGTYDRDLVYTQDWDILIRTLSMGGKLAVLPEKLFQYRSHGNNLSNSDKNAAQTFWEYAYISSKTLHPWLMGTGNDGLILGNIVGFFRHEMFTQLNENERVALTSALLHRFNGTFRDFILNRNDAQENHGIEIKMTEAYSQTQLELDRLNRDRDQLRAERDQLRVQRDQLQAERDQLQLETSALAYRAITKMRYVLQTRWPRTYLLGKKMFRLTDRR